MKNNWNHYAIEFDGIANTIKLYRNGSKQKNFTISYWIKESKKGRKK